MNGYSSKSDQRASRRRRCNNIKWRNKSSSRLEQRWWRLDMAQLRGRQVARAKDQRITWIMPCRTCKCTMISSSFHIVNGSHIWIQRGAHLVHTVTSEDLISASSLRGCTKVGQTSPCSSICKTPGSKVSNMPIFFKTRIGIAKHLASRSTIRRCTQRAFTSIHKMVYCTLLKELPLVLILAFQDLESEKDLNGRKWILLQICPRKIHWWAT